MSAAANIITAAIMARPGDLAGVPPAIIRETVRRACAHAVSLIGEVQSGYEGVYPEPSGGTILETELSQCLVCCARVALADTIPLGWRQDSEGEDFCGPCFEDLEEDEGEAGMPGLAAMGMEP